MKYLSLVLVLFLFISCASKQAIENRSATILIKTPNMKFYDKGFINRYEEYIHLQIYTVGHLALNLKIYKDEVCQSTLECVSSKEFNAKYLHSSYKDDFIYKLFLQSKVYHKDRENGILIKVK